MAPDGSPNYPLSRECPGCKSSSGAPYAVKAMPKGRTEVAMRCQSCGHQWTLEMHDPTGAAELDDPDETP